MLQRFLLTLLVLTFIVSVPYESFAAPRKESRKERRERKKTRKNDKVQRPVKQKITPTLEEKLTPKQVQQKIRTIRHRIETAPEHIISQKEKPILLEVFDDMVKTPLGHYLFEKAHPNLNFCVKDIHAAGVYATRSQCITLSKRHFEDIYKSALPEKIASSKVGLASTIAHETTHSLQYVNNMNDRSDMSFEEIITINKLFELHATLNESVASCQVAELPKYRSMHPKSNIYRPLSQTLPGEMSVLPQHIFYKELRDAKRAIGVSEQTAERFARTVFIERFWNNKTTPVQVGTKTITLTPSTVNAVMNNWNTSYNATAYRRLPYGTRSDAEIMKDLGIQKNIRRFIDVMGIDTPPSFFRDPETTSFNMPSARRVVCYLDGIKNAEYDNITTGFIVKAYDKGVLSEVFIVTNQKQEKPQNKTYTEYYEGTRTKKITYTYKNGKMNGIYREYDKNGRQLLEMPVVNDKADGNGWVLENGVRAHKKFTQGCVSPTRKRE